jgi:hypothetical protein
MEDALPPEQDAKLTPAERLLLTLSDPRHRGMSAQLMACLAIRFGDQVGIYPGTSPLARAFNICRQQVWKAEILLQEMGWIQLVPITEGRDKDKRSLKITLPDKFPQSQMTALHEVGMVASTAGILDLPAAAPVARPARKPRVPKPPADAPPPLPADAANPVGDDAEPKDKPKEVPAAKPAKGLTEELKAKILTSPDAMERYLLWGRDGVPDDVDTSTLKPVPTNWRQHGGNLTDPKAELWDIPAFMGYFWFRVTKYRAGRDIQLTLPMWKRLAGDFKNLLATMTKVDFHRLIGVVVQHFDLIRYKLRGIGSQVALNETALSSKLIKDTAFNLAQMSVEQLAPMYDEMKKFYGWDKEQQTPNQ